MECYSICNWRGLSLGFDNKTFCAPIKLQNIAKEVVNRGRGFMSGSARILPFYYPVLSMQSVSFSKSGKSAANYFFISLSNAIVEGEKFMRRTNCNAS